MSFVIPLSRGGAYFSPQERQHVVGEHKKHPSLNDTQLARALTAGHRPISSVLVRLFIDANGGDRVGMPGEDEVQFNAEMDIEALSVVPLPKGGLSFSPEERLHALNEHAKHPTLSPERLIQALALGGREIEITTVSKWMSYWRAGRKRSRCHSRELWDDDAFEQGRESVFSEMATLVEYRGASHRFRS